MYLTFLLVLYVHGKEKNALNKFIQEETFRCDRRLQFLHVHVFIAVVL